MDYDTETDKLVGFVLPSNDEGMPLSNSFIAVSFDFVKETFLTAEIGVCVSIYGSTFTRKCSYILFDVHSNR